MRAAPAQVPRQPRLHLFHRRMRIGLQQRFRRHHHATRAVAALRRLFRDERFLHGIGLLRRPDPFNRHDTVPCGLPDRRHAGARDLPVNQHRARAALAQTAAKLWPVQVERIAEQIEQRLLGIPGVDTDVLIVDSKLEIRHTVYQYRAVCRRECGPFVSWSFRMPVSLENTSVLVIGASSGMGRETARLFAREGALVTAVARRLDRLQQLQAELAAEGRTIAIAEGDATDPAAMERVAAQAGDVSILVYATGTNIPDRALSRLTPELWDMMIGVNLNGAYYATRAVLPGMCDRKAGLIFYVSSKSAVHPDESGAAYQAAKRGLAGLAQAVRLEEKDNGIRTCVVCPGLTDTDLILKRPVPTPAETMAKALHALDVAEMIVSIARLPARTWVPEVHLFPSAL